MPNGKYGVVWQTQCFIICMFRQFVFKELAYYPVTSRHHFLTASMYGHAGSVSARTPSIVVIGCRCQATAPRHTGWLYRGSRQGKATSGNFSHGRGSREGMLTSQV